MRCFEYVLKRPSFGNRLIISPKTNTDDIRIVRGILGPPLAEGVFSDSKKGNVKRLADLVRLTRGERWKMLRGDVRAEHDINAMFSVLLPDQEKEILQPLVDVNTDRRRVQIVVTPVRELQNTSMLTPSHILDKIMDSDSESVFIAYPLDYYHHIGVIMVAVLRELGYDARVSIKYKLIELETPDKTKQFHVNQLISAAIIEPSKENELIVVGFGPWNAKYDHIDVFDDDFAVGVVGLLTAFNTVMKIARRVKLTEKVKINEMREFVEAMNVGLNMIPGNGELEMDFMAPAFVDLVKNMGLMNLLGKLSNFNTFIEESVGRLEQIGQLERETLGDPDPETFS